MSLKICIKCRVIAYTSSGVFDAIVYDLTCLHEWKELNSILDNLKPNCYKSKKEPQMLIKFIQEIKKPVTELTFDMVEDNQFFVCVNRYLCQKVDYCEYNVLADSHGNLVATNITVDPNATIWRILPTITKIEF